MSDLAAHPAIVATSVHSVELTAAWAKCVGAWADEQMHERALQLASLQQGYVWLAQRYAAVAKQRPDDAIAARQLARLTQATEAALAASLQAQSGRARLPSKKLSPTMVVVVMVVFLLLSGLVMMRVLRAPTTTPASVPVGIPRADH